MSFSPISIRLADMLVVEVLNIILTPDSGFERFSNQIVKGFR